MVELRSVHPAWGGRKLRRRLLDQGVEQVPAASTITEILRRRDLLSELKGCQAFQRFERERPNELWQMDFKGHFGLGAGGRCHPLTVLDDHSRYALVLQACGNEQGQTVQERLTQTFRRYGMPESMLMDNGSPWGDDRESPWTPLTVWLLRLGVRVIHGRPYHPQTQGKEERFHRTLVAEVLQGRVFRDLQECQVRFDEWRVIYNHERPHEALDLASTPGSRYEPRRAFVSGTTSELEFSPTDVLRKVQKEGWFSFRGREWRISKAFRGERVGVRPTVEEGVWEVWFGRQCLGAIDQRADAEHWRVVRRPQGEQAAALGVEEERTPFAPLTASVPPHSVMSMCYPCVRTPVTLDSGPNSGRGVGGEGGRRVWRGQSVNHISRCSYERATAGLVSSEPETQRWPRRSGR